MSGANTHITPWAHRRLLLGPDSLITLFCRKKSTNWTLENCSLINYSTSCDRIHVLLFSSILLPLKRPNKPAKVPLLRRWKFHALNLPTFSSPQNTSQRNIRFFRHPLTASLVTTTRRAPHCPVCAPGDFLSLTRATRRLGPYCRRRSDWPAPAACADPGQPHADADSATYTDRSEEAARLVRGAPHAVR